MRKAIRLLLVLLLSSACSAISISPTPVKLTTTNTSFTQPTITVKSHLPLEETPTLTASPSIQVSVTSTVQLIIPSPTPDPKEWQSWPVIPVLTAHGLEIYRRGLALGNNPQAFSKLGDCETDTDWYLTSFDKADAYYNLGPYENELSDVIQYFKGSFNWDSLAAQDGGSAATLLNPMWANPDKCKSGETPLDCEIRLHKPSFALIAVGTNDTVHVDRFESNMRKVIDHLIEMGVVPVLGTKADNLEGDNSINLTMAKLANEYDLPLWNFWAAVQPLPDHGLSEDGAHLTWARNDFSDPNNMEKAWPVRNLTALRVLNAMRLAVISQK